MDPINPPDENTFSPHYDSPQSIVADFDNVYVNGALYDDFESGGDLTKWQSQPPEVTGVGGVAHFEKDWGMATSGSTWLQFTNPDGKNTIKTIVKVESGTSLPRARIGGTFCKDSQGDVFAQIGIRANDAVYSVETDWDEGNHSLYKSLVPLTSIGSVTAGNRYEITLDWDGTTFTFTVVGLDDSINYKTTYTPSGPTTPLTGSRKGIGVTSWLSVDTTTPTFDWAEIPGASHYRVRIYSLDNGNILYTGYTAAPPYTLPPGILKPNGMYKYRVYAIKDHQWFMADNVSASDKNNTIIIVDADEAQAPYVDLYSHGVYTWTIPSPFGTYTYFYLRIHDAQGVPGNIQSVTALFPDGSTEVNLYREYNETPTCAIYQGMYLGSIQEGEYQISVMDRDGHSDTSTDTLESSPVGFPSKASLWPAEGTVIWGTKVSFDWDDVLGAALYEVKIYDKDYNQLYSAKTTSSDFTLPAGVLKENSLYRYRILTYGDFFENNVNNESSIPMSLWGSNTFFTSQATIGSATPDLDISRFGVNVAEMPHPATGAPLYALEFSAMVTDSDGVPENIKNVEVTYPDGTTKQQLKYSDSPDWGYNYYESTWLTDTSSLQEGTYTFRVEDVEGNVVTLTDTLSDISGNVLPWVTNVAPADGAELTGTTPLITWHSVTGASYYKTCIMNADGSRTVHWSEELTQASYTVPEGVLDLNTTYSYRVYAYREPSGSEVDFYSCNRCFFIPNDHFTTGDRALLDSDSDGIADDVEAASCMDPHDADTDDDGIADGTEDVNHNGMVDAGETDPCLIDSDGDGIQDGTELGVTVDNIGPQTDSGIFIPDLDPTTTSDPTLSDSDRDGLPDGAEDLNRNGLCEAGETNPSPQCGDVNDDCQTNLEDLIQILQVVTKKEVTGRAAGDCNGDNLVGIPEAIATLEKLSK